MAAFVCCGQLLFFGGGLGGVCVKGIGRSVL